MKLKGVRLGKPKAPANARMIITLPKVLKARLDKVQETGQRVAITKALDEYEKSR